MVEEEKKTSPWVWVGVGCASVVVIGIVAVALVGFWGYRKAKQLGEELKDPRARAAKVHRVLGCEKLPAGYHAIMALSLPFVMDLAIISDKPPEADGQIRGLGSRSFIYLKLLSTGKDQQELRDFFEGKTSDAEVLRRNKIHVDSRETIRRGTLELSDERLLYLAQRGEVRVQGGEAKGVTSLMLIDCSGDTKQRMGIWFGPDPSPDTPASDMDFSGTPADENAIRDFMSHFHLCRAA